MANNTSGAPAVVPRRRPTTDQIRKELARMEKKRGLSTALKVLVFLIVVLLVAAITFFCLLSGYVIYGNSMSPSLNEKDLVLAIPKAPVKTGDLAAFRHEDRILIKRVIAGPGDRVEVLNDGRVIINGSELYEPYAFYSTGGVNDMSYPLDIPEHTWFVLGDNRGSSVDSRSSILGLIGDEQMQGKVFVRVWPLNRFQLYDKNFFSEFLNTLTNK